MKLDNRSPLSALLLRNASARSDGHMLACVIARARFRARADGTLSPPAPWPIDPAPGDTPFGRSPGDKPFYTGGIDVLLGGRVTQPERKPAARLEVEVEVGRQFRRRIAVIGDRRWTRTEDGRVVPGLADVFLSMPLSNDRAFGGRARRPEGELPYPANPEGRGYYHDAAQAVGQPLPNLEQPGQLVERVDDRPVPVGLGCYPSTGALRAIAAIDHPAAAAARGVMFGKGTSAGEGAPAPEPPPATTMIPPGSLRPTMFNHAHPDMIIEARKGPEPGDPVRLAHGRPDGSDLVFAIPALPLHLHVQLEDRHHLLPLHLDQIGILGGDEVVMLGYRVVFEYPTKRGERRFATLYPGPMPAEVPQSYHHTLDEAWVAYPEG